MDISGFGSVASSALSLAGTIASIESSRDMQETEMRYNEHQSGLNRDWQTQERIAAQEYYTNLFNLSNEWNSLGAQLERGRLAGVSPSAIISGKVNGTSAQPSMPNVGSGAQASTSSGGAIGSALVGAMPNMLNATGSFVKNMTDSFIARDMLGLNKQYMQSQINLNYGSLKETLANAGVADATKDQIYQSIRWAEDLNYVEVQKRIAQSTLYYNQCADILSMIEYRNAQATNLDYQNANLAGQTYLSYVQGNKANIEAAIAEIIGTQISIEELTQEHLQTIESNIRVNFANMVGVPVGSSEFEFNYAVWRTGEYPSYVRQVYVPQHVARLKPSDYVIDGVPYLGTYDPLSGFFNPHQAGWQRTHNYSGRVVDGLLETAGDVVRVRNIRKGAAKGASSSAPAPATVTAPTYY